MFEEQSRLYERMAQAIHLIASNSTKQPTLTTLANTLCMSEFHFQRTFKEWVGITPKQFLQFTHREAAKPRLLTSPVSSVSDALGYSSESRLYDNFVRFESITPSEYKHLAKDLVLGFGLASSPFGPCLFVWSERGLCKLDFLPSSDAGELQPAIDALAEKWPCARFERDDKAAKKLASRVFTRSTQHDDAINPLKLWVKGSVFQIKVWEALLKINEGEVASYQALAKLAGNETGVRAVASAVGKNPIAYLIPCHRVIRSCGAINKYRWGEERKASMLFAELGQRYTDKP